MKEIQERIDLNGVTHSVRAAQAVLQYGVGAMIDFPDQTLMTAAPETWKDMQIIHDDRFAKALDVDYFSVPTNIAYARFPEWYFCPKCRKFQPIDKWISEYQKRTSAYNKENDSHMARHMQCPVCRQDLVVARIVTICEQGHINDFPWVKWVHMQSKKSICANPSLQFKTGTSGSEGLEGLSIVCSCGAFATLKGAFDKDCFERLDERNEDPQFRCEGHHPHKHVKEKCICYPKTVQRGSSSVYFPVIYSSLVIPPYADKLTAQVEKSNQYADCEAALSSAPALRDMMLTTYFTEWVEKIAIEVGTKKADIEAVLKRKWYGEGITETDITSVKYKIDEYEALSGEAGASATATGDFSREGIQKELFRGELPHIKAVSLIEKVRVVNALIGFSRINPVTGKDAVGFVHVKEPETRWYPAYEVRGEGIFIEFEHGDIENWLETNPEVVRRATLINDNYARSFIGQKHPRIITPKFLLLHTVSHLLIKQLSFECGYNLASLSERLYCAEESDGKKMAGIFIYTASGDSEGTLGGLVRQGRPDAFPNIFKKAIDEAKICSGDPVCILSHGQGRESLNLAACHACALLPETCCEERNGFLDRGVVVGTYEDRSIGFFSETSIPANASDASSKNTPIPANNNARRLPVNIDLKFNGIPLLPDYQSWKEAEILLEDYPGLAETLSVCKVPLADGIDGNAFIKGENVRPVLFWSKQRLLIFDDNSALPLFSDSGWIAVSAEDVTADLLSGIFGGDNG